MGAKFAKNSGDPGRWLVGLTLSAMFLGLAGCNKTEPIRVYTVAKPPPAVKPASSGGGATGRGDAQPEAAAGEPGRMLGAIVPHGDKTWFFKLTGPSEAVIGVATPFLEFIRSLRFEGEVPKWTAPEGWTEKPGNEFRFATLVIESPTGPLELTVSPLPTGEGNFNDQLLANVNRWRGQMQVAPMDAAQLEKSTLSLDVGELKVWLVNIEGRLGATGKGGPRAGAAREPKAGAAEKGASDARPLPPLPFQFTLPEGWTRKAAGPMRMAEFEVNDGDQKVTISASIAGGDLVANINRWRGQIGLEAAEEKALRESLRKIEVGSIASDYAELIGPKGDKPAQAILGVIVPSDGRQWFFKLQGDADLAKREQTKFETFVKSIEFSK